MRRDVGSYVAVAPTRAVPRWDVLDWLVGNTPIAVLVTGMSPGEWSSGVEPLEFYEQVLRAQFHVLKVDTEGSVEFLADPQVLVDVMHRMEMAGWPAGDLIADRTRKAIRRHRIQPSPNPRRIHFGGQRANSDRRHHEHREEVERQRLPRRSA